MNQKASIQLERIGSQEAIEIIDAFKDKVELDFSLPVTNRDAIRKLAQGLTRAYFLSVHYNANQHIVESGAIVLDNPALNYAYVPLGLIVSGQVVVLKGGKATKCLSQGDFIGLFETGDWLNTGKKREIGDWTLVADTDVRIVYFPEDIFRASEESVEAFKKYLLHLARIDAVPQPISTMPVLDWVASHTTRERLHDYAIIAHTHLLPNNVPFFRHLSYLVDFGRLYVLEKPYSTVPSAYTELVRGGAEIVNVKMEPGMPYEYASRKSIDILWSKIIEDQKKKGFTKLLVIDDGGDLWMSIPWDSLQDVEIVGVEQTQRGTTRIQESRRKIPPVVSVASSGVKKIVESQFIGKSVADKLCGLALLTLGKKIGVLGMGSIGTAVVQRLKELGMNAYFYDPVFHEKLLDNPWRKSSIDSLLNTSDILIGTTGADSLKGVAFERVSGHKIFASASSADVEFASVLKFALASSEPFGTQHVQVHESLTVDVLNGGYPINFDREKDATPSDDIVLTRSLMYIGAMQAVALLHSGKAEGVYALDMAAQKKLLEHWIEYKKKIEQNPIVEKDAVDSIVQYSVPDEKVADCVPWSE